MPMAGGNRAYVRRGQYPPVFAVWLAIRHRGPICERWRPFVNFYLDVGPRPSWRHLLIRDDTSRDFSPGKRPMADCAGISAGAHSTMMAGRPKRALLGDAGKLGTGRNRPLAGTKQATQRKAQRWGAGSDRGSTISRSALGAT